jgi:hypothetical protein
MPEKQTLERARRAKREGKRPTTQASEFVREEIRHVREGKHGARSAKQAIAIGLSKARRAGVKLGPPPKGTKATTRRRSQPSAKRSRATLRALKREPRAAASRPALARQARQAARRRGPAARKAAARKAVATKGPAVRKAAARKAAATRKAA